MLCNRSPRLWKKVQKVDNNKDKEVKRSARNDRRSFVEELARKAECAAGRGEMCVVYKIAK